MKHPALTRRLNRLAKIPLQKEQARLILAGQAPLIYPLLAIEKGRLVIAVKCSRIRGCAHYRLSFRCPICGQLNSHTISEPTQGAGDGERASACPCWSGIGYIIRESQD